MKTFGAGNRKSALKMIKKHYLEKVFATRFQNVKKPYKTNGKHGLSQCVKNLIKTMENAVYQNAKMLSKTL